MIELIMVMIIIGILAAVSIPRFTNIVRQSEAASEQGVLINLVAALDTYSQERFIEDGVLSWPVNPFDALNKQPQSYDKSQSTLMQDMDDSDWIFTGQASNDYKNSIVHRRKEDSLAVWTYNPSNGEIGYSNPPYQPNQVVYRPDLQGQ
jgi:type II secretory pathway pseudopilin PulG